MTKKHFEAFARYIRDYTWPTGFDQSTTEAERSAMAHMVMNIAQDFNPRFDRQRFLKACGLGD